MSVRQSQELSEFRLVLRLGEAVRSAPDNVTRKRSLLLGLCDLLDASTGLCVMTHLDRRSRRRTVLSVVATKAGDPDATKISDLNATEIEFATEGDAEAPPLAKPRRPVADPEVAAGANSNGLRFWQSKSYCKGPCLYSLLHVGETGLTASIRICSDRKRYSARQRAIVDLIHLELGWIYRADLPLASPEALALSPRQRDVLELLLSGDSEKQIAGKLNVSHNTVHHHVKAIHRHFNVSSRSELLARWVGK